MTPFGEILTFRLPKDLQSAIKKDNSNYKKYFIDGLLNVPTTKYPFRITPPIMVVKILDIFPTKRKYKFISRSQFVSADNLSNSNYLTHDYNVLYKHFIKQDIDYFLNNKHHKTRLRLLIVKIFKLLLKGEQHARHKKK